MAPCKELPLFDHEKSPNRHRHPRPRPCDAWASAGLVKDGGNWSHRHHRQFASRNSAQDRISKHWLSDNVTTRPIRPFSQVPFHQKLRTFLCENVYRFNTKMLRLSATASQCPIGTASCCGRPGECQTINAVKEEKIRSSESRTTPNPNMVSLNGSHPEQAG